MSSDPFFTLNEESTSTWIGPRVSPLIRFVASRAVSKWNEDDPASKSLSSSDLRFLLVGDNADIETTEDFLQGTMI